MSNITVKIAERSENGNLIKEYNISGLNIDANSSCEDVFAEIGMDVSKFHIITEINWDDVDPDVHENNALYLMDVCDALKLLHELNAKIDSIGIEQINAEFEAGWYINEIIEHSDDVYLIDVNDEYELGYRLFDQLNDCKNMPEYIRKYIDYEAFGRDLVLMREFSHTTYGYLSSY